KADLFRLGYIATHSGHSTGAALDLSLVDLKADNSATFDATKDYGDCTANVNLRAPDGSVDMGTGYDCSDVRSHTAAKSVTAAQRRWSRRSRPMAARRRRANYASSASIGARLRWRSAAASPTRTRRNCAPSIPGATVAMRSSFILPITS